MKSTCTLINKSSGRVVYNVKDPEISAHRVIYPSQSMPGVPVRELEKLVQSPGGMNLFYNYLMVDDEEVLNYLLHGAKPAPEYWLTEDKIPSWINTCSVDEFRDALDFAPEGTKDLIKKYSVSTPLRDYDKRQAMLEQLGFDVSAAIELSKPEKEEKPAAAVIVPTGGRRSATTSIVKTVKKEE